MSDVIDLEVIVKVKIDACYAHEATPKKVQELLDEYGLQILREPEVLFVYKKEDE